MTEIGSGRWGGGKGRVFSALKVLMWALTNIFDVLHGSEGGTPLEVGIFLKELLLM